MDVQSRILHAFNVTVKCAGTSL